jgi:hypothetical protein
MTEPTVEPERHDYHYNREERLAMPGAAKRSAKSKGIFRLTKNRGTMILLVDIIVIVIVAIIYRQFIYEPPYRGELEEYGLLLRGFVLDDRVMVDLQIEHTRDVGAQEGERVFALFTAGSREIRLSAPLPGDGQTISLNGAIVTGEQPDLLEVSVTIGNHAKTLSRKLKPE